MKKNKFDFSEIEKNISENIEKIYKWTDENSYSKIKRKVKSFETIETDQLTQEDIDKTIFLKNQLDYINNLESLLYKDKRKLEKVLFQFDKKLQNIDLNILLIEKKENKYNDIIDSKKNINGLEYELNELKYTKEELLKLIKESSWKNSNVLINKNKLHIINDKIVRLTKKIKSIEKLSDEKYFQKYNKYHERKFNNKNKLKVIKNDLTEKITHLLKIIKHINNALNRKQPEKSKYIIKVNNLNTYYGKSNAIKNININIPKNKIISIIGPSGCGKSTFLRTLNRINDEIPGFKFDGEIIFDDEYDVSKLKSISNKYNKIEITELRSRIGMIFQNPNPFPMSIFKNVSYGPKINGVKNKFILNQIVIDSLKDAALYDDVKDNLNILATSLSGGQQQRLCIARAIANKPDVLLMDEPTSSLDPISSSKIENLILKLKKDYTIIIVTHSMQQAARISDYTAFFYQGELIEFDKTKKMFTNPRNKQTEDYIRGKFG